MSAPKVYNADQVTIAIAETLIDSGFADGQFLEYQEISDQVQSVAGSNGEVAISKNNDPRVAFTLQLLQTSDANDILSALHEQRRSLGRVAVVPYVIRDRNGRALHEGRCWIKKAPTMTLDRTATARSWAFEGVEDYGFDGGNLSVGV